MSISVKFVFSNSNATVDAKISKTAVGLEIKQLLLSKWPRGVPVCKETDRIRIICLGRVIMDDEECVGNRHFKSDVPLPVNVSVKPSADEIQKITSSKNIKDVSGSGKHLDVSESGRGGGFSGGGGGGGGGGGSGRRPVQSREGMEPTPALTEVCQCTVS